MNVCPFFSSIFHEFVSLGGKNGYLQFILDKDIYSIQTFSPCFSFPCAQARPRIGIRILELEIREVKIFSNFVCNVLHNASRGNIKCNFRNSAALEFATGETKRFLR